jgi:hypothetical protein
MLGAPRPERLDGNFSRSLASYLITVGAGPHGRTLTGRLRCHLRTGCL